MTNADSEEYDSEGTCGAGETRAQMPRGDN